MIDAMTRELLQNLVRERRAKDILEALRDICYEEAQDLEENVESDSDSDDRNEMSEDANNLHHMVDRLDEIIEECYV